MRIGISPARQLHFPRVGRDFVQSLIVAGLSKQWRLPLTPLQGVVVAGRHSGFRQNCHDYGGGQAVGAGAAGRGQSIM